jgi:hypothetical protein
MACCSWIGRKTADGLSLGEGGHGGRLQAHNLSAGWLASWTGLDGLAGSQLVGSFGGGGLRAAAAAAAAAVAAVAVAVAAAAATGAEAGNQNPGISGPDRAEGEKPEEGMGKDDRARMLAARNGEHMFFSVRRHDGCPRGSIHRSSKRGRRRPGRRVALRGGGQGFSQGRGGTINLSISWRGCRTVL